MRLHPADKQSQDPDARRTPSTSLARRARRPAARLAALGSALSLGVAFLAMAFASMPMTPTSSPQAGSATNVATVIGPAQVGTVAATSTSAIAAADTAAATTIAAPRVVPQVAPAALTVSLHPVVSGLSSPVAFAAPDDGTGRMFVVEQAGRIRIVQGGRLLAGAYLDIRGRVSCCGERGLLGLAFHPQFATNHRFFVYYTTNTGNLQVSEFHQSASNANRAATTERKILTIGHRTYSNHNGGQLAFGRDGYLYIGTGDGGGGGDPFRSGQSRKTLLGKILRIDINGTTGTKHYRIPPTNPWARSTVYKREIWAYGLRNPWRFSFDRSTGDLWIADVGQDRYEEIDRALRSAGGGRGKNYGWSVIEGRTCYRPSSGCNRTGKTAPVAVYSHAGGRCSVTGGFVYRGTASAALVGKYLLADFCSGTIWTLNARSTVGSLHQVADFGFTISSFGQGVAGELYVLDYSNGRLLHLTAP